MGKKKKIKGIVYSTNPDYKYQFEEEPEPETLSATEQKLRIFLEKKGRSGKTATVVKGFTGTRADLEELGRTLKNHCATGGSAKEGVIILQGDVRDKALAYLTDHGYPAKKAGG